MSERVLTEDSITQGFLPYGRQSIDDDDITEVVRVLRSDWLTQGPTVDVFETSLGNKLKASHTVACVNGTAALHLTMLALGVGEGDMVLTSPVTFVASANCARFVGARVGFVDVDPDTALMSPAHLEKALDSDTDGKIKAVIPVHFAGQPVDLPAIHEICSARSIAVVDDCCHAIGAWFERNDVRHALGANNYSTMSVFSFHPVKHIATGEGGAVTTADQHLASRLRILRNHGITRDVFKNADMAYSASGELNPWYHEMQELSGNFRISDIHSALGLSQLKKLDNSLKIRNRLASLYDDMIAAAFDPEIVRPLTRVPGTYHAFHLYVLQIDFEKLKISRAAVMNGLRSRNIGTQVHYIPVHLQPYYRNCCGTRPGDLPNAERYYSRALSIPMYPALSDSDCERVVRELKTVLRCT